MTQGWVVFRLFGMPVWIHLSILLGAVLPSLFLGFKPLQIVSLGIALTLLIAIHEAGHPVMARLTGVRVLGVSISGFGGACYCQDFPNRKAAILVYSGGLLAQLLLFIGTCVTIWFYDGPGNIFTAALSLVFTIVNAFVFVINVLPIKARPGQYTDGYHLVTLMKPQ